MEKHQQHNLNAKKHLNTADHMLTITYPMIKDPKILLAVLDNLNVAVKNMMEAVLEYDYLFKNISGFDDTFIAKYSVFKQKCAKRYSFDDGFMELLKELNDTHKAHKESPVEFPRKNSFIICNKNYETKKITFDDLKQKIAKAKLNFNILQNVFKNDRIFN